MREKGGEGMFCVYLSDCMYIRTCESVQSLETRSDALRYSLALTCNNRIINHQ